MKYGFDIDDTLINLREHAFHLYNKKLGQKQTLQTFHSIPTVEIHQPFGLTDIEGSKMWQSLLDEIYFTNCPSFDGAVELLQQLANEGHEIYYITARAAEYGEQTREWMKLQGFPVVDDNFYCGMKDSEKVTIIKQLALDVYTDDKPSILQTLSETTTKCILVDQSYNRKANFPRLYHWSEWLTLIK